MIRAADSSAAFRRVLVIGCGGAGKTTLALELGEITGLPVFHLDRHSDHVDIYRLTSSKDARKFLKNLEHRCSGELKAHSEERME